MYSKFAKNVSNEVPRGEIAYNFSFLAELWISNFEI